MKSIVFQCLSYVVLAVMLSACAATRTIEKIPPAEEREQIAEDKVKTYDPDAAGSVDDLYGEETVIAHSDAYVEAVTADPTLKYNVIYFDFNRSDIKPESEDLLRRHAEYLQENPEVFVVLEGHADKRGSEGYNLALGERRALGVKRALVSFGVAESRLSVISFGEEKPAVLGDSEEVFSKNRRVELVYQ